MRPPVPISWEALMAEPTRFAALPMSDQDTIYAQIAGLEAAWRPAVLTRRSAFETGRQGPAETERALRLAEAAARLGMSKDYLYRHWRKLGGYKDDDGHVKFALSAIQRHVNARRP